jgi:hypothetical protein
MTSMTVSAGDIFAVAAGVLNTQSDAVAMSILVCLLVVLSEHHERPVRSWADSVQFPC